MLRYFGGLAEIHRDDAGLQELAVFEGLSEIPLDAIGLIDAVGLVLGKLFEGLAVEIIWLATGVSSVQSSPISDSPSESSVSGLHSHSRDSTSSSHSLSSRLEIPAVFGFPANHDLHVAFR